MKAILKSSIKSNAQIRRLLAQGFSENNGVLCNVTEEQFREEFATSLFNTTGKLLDSHATGKTHFEQMFKVMDAKDATNLLNACDFVEWLHPDVSASIRRRI